MQASAVSFFCWQLPTYSGTKSYQNLLVGVYGIGYNGSWITGLRNFDSRILASSLLRSGRYDYGSGGISNRSSEGYFWESNPYSATNARRLDFTSTYLNPQNSNNKGYGFTVRCLVR